MRKFLVISLLLVIAVFGLVVSNMEPEVIYQPGNVGNTASQHPTVSAKQTSEPVSGEYIAWASPKELHVQLAAMGGIKQNQTSRFVQNLAVESNSFRLYEVVYPGPGFNRLKLPAEFVSEAKKGALIIDLTNSYIRIRLENGDEYVFNKDLFKAGSEDNDRNTDNYVPFRYDSWMVGNQFVAGQVICAIPRSVIESFPDWGVVIGTEGEFVYILGHSGPINSEHFQKCK